MEVLVKKAAVDEDFRARLLCDRVAAADEIGLELTPTEQAMLSSVPDRQLESIISRTEVPDGSRNAKADR